MIFRYRPPVWPFTLNADSPHARGAVLVAPMLRGLPPMDLVTGQVFAWSGTAPPYTVPAALEGLGPLHAETIDGNNSGHVQTGQNYGLSGVNTLTVEWWQNEDGRYLSDDGDRHLVSNRTAGNAGWSAGRYLAVGGPPGNSTQLAFTIQRVARYEGGHHIAARKWTHCACTLNGTSLRFYVGGVEVSSTTTGSMTSGGSLVILGQGPSGGNPWLNDAHSIIVRNTPLSAGEIAMRADPAETWDLYYEIGRRTYFIPAAAPPGGFIAAWARQRSAVIGGGLH